MGTALDLAQSLEAETCCTCGVLFAIPAHLRAQLRKNHNWFYCPNGHTQHYTSETDAEKLKKQVERLTKEKEWAVQAQTKAEAETAKLKKRVAKGTCPCCKRTVSQLARHMETKHPGYGK